MNVEVFLAGVAASAVLIAHVADKQHRKAKKSAAAVAAAFSADLKERRRVIDSGPVHIPPAPPRPAPSALTVGTDTRRETTEAYRSSDDDNRLTQMLVTAIVLDSMTPDTPATSSSHDSGSSWSSSDSGSSSYDSGSSFSSDSGGGGGW
jgi:hypothetical protein